MQGLYRLRWPDLESPTRMRVVAEKLTNLFSVLYYEHCPALLTAYPLELGEFRWWRWRGHSFPEEEERRLSLWLCWEYCWFVWRYFRSSEMVIKGEATYHRGALYSAVSCTLAAWLHYSTLRVRVHINEASPYHTFVRCTECAAV